MSHICAFCNGEFLERTEGADKACYSCLYGGEAAKDRLSKAGLDTNHIEQFVRYAEKGHSPESAMLRVIADLTDDTRLPGKDQEPVGVILRRFRSWQATVRRASEILAAPRGL